MNLLAIFISCTCILSSAVFVNGLYTDCERPPTILHGRTELTVDDYGVVVTGTYTCDTGYQLHGESQLICNTDTDEWQGDLPACKQETGDGAQVSEIEQPETVSETATVPPNVTHEEISKLVEEAEAVSNEIEQPNQPIPVESEYEPTPETPQQKRRRKGKYQDAEEDTTIDEEFASRLDLSCIGDAPVAAPSINDAYVLKYSRGKRGDRVFLVAIYSCDEEYELENAQVNRLYCSNENWIGNYPVCVSGSSSGLDYGGESEEDVENEYRNVHAPEPEPEPEPEPVPDLNVVTPSNENSIYENVAHENENEIKENFVENRIGATEPTTITNEIVKEMDVSAGVISGNEGITLPVASCEINNGGCEQNCALVPDSKSDSLTIECSCEDGFFLDSNDAKRCLDINECENTDFEQTCTYGCVNTIGSYRCVEPNQEVEIIATNNVDARPTTEREPAIDLSPIKTCGDGFILDSANNCLDIDECKEGNTGCEYCQNSFGGFQCTCPDGFELNSDEKTCRDIDECTTFSDYEYDENMPTAKSICSHQCVNLVGSYICICPERFHLRSDKRTCEQDLCQHLGDTAANKTKCSHECVDEADGYHCKCPNGMDLDSDMKTCISLDACANAGDRCSPGACVNADGGSFRCECPTGFAEHNQRCIDYDECAIGTHQCSHKCRNIDGSYICECPDDLILLTDEHTCVSVDKCQNENGGCSDICHLSNGEVICACHDGAQLRADGRTCEAVNICDTNNGGCPQVCHVELNRCECFPGFETIDDGKTCTDVNECLLNNGGCPQECVNNEGSFVCSCFEGFRKDSESGVCLDHDECQSNNGNCDHECTNTLGSYVCSCRSGYRNAVNQHQCVDIDECVSNNGGCSHTCVNLQGSYQCSCPEGQFLVNDDHTCDFLNECEVNNGGCSHECNYHKGVLNCSCPFGYQLDESQKNCVDQNECLVNNGGCSHQCENLDGKHVCKCNVGYQLGADKGTCIDMDECIEDNGNCSNICINLLGSYSCACEAGFELDVDKHTCIDIDECVDAIHDCAQKCINVPGAYECECSAGYKLSRDHFGCDDIDECTLENKCAIASDCVNTIGSYHCNCPNGYELSPINKTCVDIDECHKGLPKRCSHECENTAGAFKCLCPNGMELASDLVTCVDINECVVNSGICSHFCDNIEGSFRCRCPSGYKLDDDQVTCKDIDECAIQNGQCEQRCVNNEGNFKCECNLDGFELADDGKKCIGSEPCALKNGGCAHVCEPLNGKAQCYCYKGFELSMIDNSSCIDINECQLNHGCQSKCVNTVGSYKCDCPEGFRLNDVGNCIDINECEHFNGGCSPNSECINFLGSFRCICPTGFKLARDKVTCMEIKDNCAAIPAPENGDVRCTRSRHRSQLFYKTKCSIWCHESFTLIGPSVKHCNGSGGAWDPTETLCVPSSCPPLPSPTYGTLTPPDCSTGKIYPGESCTLSCPPGFKSVGTAVATCLADQRWSNTNFNCAAIETATKTRVQQGETHSRGHIEAGEMHSRGKIELELAPAPQNRQQSVLRPYIKCPRDTTIVLPKNKKTVYVKLEQPKSNVDWANHIDAHPAWAKNLQAYLTAGIHTITFRARSPNAASITEVCRTVITVKPAAIATNHVVNEVLYCPSSFEVQLLPNEVQRVVYWKEPIFSANQHLKQIFKSKLPGTQFGSGLHRIAYIGVDLRGAEVVKCEFSVTVRPAAIARVTNAYQGPQYENHLANHESYLMCPGKPAMKLDTSFPIQLPNGCFVKNVRLRHYNPHRRRHALSSPSNSYLRYYSSWNRPQYLTY